MKLFLLFLFSAFLVGANPSVRRFAERPIVLIGACAVVSAMFFSYRFG